MELGVYSFGDVQRRPDGELGPTSEAIKNLLEAIKLADEVGLGYFGVGEHHSHEFPVSSPATVLAAAGAVTKNIKLGSSVTVLGTDDPVRVFQQFATADAISDGRVEITAGRGSLVDAFPLFGYSLSDYDVLYAEKLDLLLKINESERVTWSGRFRSPLNNALVVPRPVNGKLKIWLGTGGNPESSIRAGVLGLPVAYAIIGGQVGRFAPVANLYRRAAEEAGKDMRTIKVAVATPGFIARDSKQAKNTFWKHWGATMEMVARQRGVRGPSRSNYDAESAPGGALFAGSPNEIADRMIDLHYKMGNMRHYLQMDVAQLPQRDFLTSIELLGTEVMPQVLKELGGGGKK